MQRQWLLDAPPNSQLAWCFISTKGSHSEQLYKSFQSWPPHASIKTTRWLEELGHTPARANGVDNLHSAATKWLLTAFSIPAVAETVCESRLFGTLRTTSWCQEQAASDPAEHSGGLGAYGTAGWLCREPVRALLAPVSLPEEENSHFTKCAGTAVGHFLLQKKVTPLRKFHASLAHPLQFRDSFILLTGFC